MTGLRSGTGALLAALFSLSPGTAMSAEPVPGLDDQKARTTLEVQVLGWSADEQRYALRVYDLTELFGDEAGPPACKAYVDHKGEKFLGGLSFVLYEGPRRIGAWRIQDAKKCTPPEVARQRLTEAKAALEKEGIDFKATGTTMTDTTDPKPTVKKKGKLTESSVTTRLRVPRGPWAGMTLEAVTVVQEREIFAKGEEEEGMPPALRAQATFQLRLDSGADVASLGELKLGPSQQPEPGVSWLWTAGFDQALLSPGGGVLVPLAYVHHGDMRLNYKARILMPPVKLLSKIGPSSGSRLSDP
jgi:hypothetical protein